MLRHSVFAINGRHREVELAPRAAQRFQSLKLPNFAVMSSRSHRLFEADKTGASLFYCVRSRAGAAHLYVHTTHIMLRSLVLVGAYLAIGVLFYTSFEDKACETLPPPTPPKKWWQPFSGPPPSLEDCREPWTVIDALYFCTVSMSTVGYGDFAPSSPASRGFTLVFIFMGITLVFVEISHACSDILMSARTVSLKLLDRLDATPIGLAGRQLGLSGNAIDIDGNGVADFALPPSWFVFWAQEMALIGIIMLGAQLQSAAVLMNLEPGLSFGQSLYQCLITATTVGYGDVDLTTQPARLWACVHILFSVTWLAALIGHVDSLQAARKSQLQRADLLRRQLDVAQITSLDHDGQGVDKLEFVVGMLIMLGAEIAGEAITWESLSPFMVKFDALDVSKNGRIDKDDLQAMVERSRAAITIQKKLRGEPTLLQRRKG